jgi:hypothetical protein
MPFPCRAHAIPLPCRAAKGLDCVFPIWFTQCVRVLFTHAMPHPCHATTMPIWKRLLKATTQRGMGAICAWPGMCELSSAVQRRHVGDLPVFGFFRLPRGLSRRTRHSRKMAGARHGMCELAFRLRREDTIEVDIKERVQESVHWMDVAGFCEHGNENSGLIKYGEFLD